MAENTVFFYGTLCANVVHNRMTLKWAIHHYGRPFPQALKGKTFTAGKEVRYE
jgi:hypothetical protein